LKTTNKKQKAPILSPPTNNLDRKMIYKKYFVVSGTGLSKTSKLNAFDNALMAAGISQCNLVPVSSILPKNAKQVKPIDIEPGTITFTVLARMDGEAGQTITAGLGWAHCTDSNGKITYGIVVEEKNQKTKKEAQKNIQQKIQEMTKNRRMKIKKQDTRTTTIQIPEGHYGSAIVSLIYTN